MKQERMEERKVQVEEWGDRMRVEVQETFIGTITREDQTMGMTFQVAGVKKVLAAVWRICKAGNIVQFGDEAADCYVKHKATGRKIILERRGGSYVLKIEIVWGKKGATGGDVWESLGSEWITVDSGAEESFSLPLGLGAEFGMQAVPPGKEMRMLNAGAGG